MFVITCRVFFPCGALSRSKPSGDEGLLKVLEQTTAFAIPKPSSQQPLKSLSTNPSPLKDGMKPVGSDLFAAAGYMFLCSDKTAKECMDRMLFGSPEKDLPGMSRIVPRSQIKYVAPSFLRILKIVLSQICRYLLPLPVHTGVHVSASGTRRLLRSFCTTIRATLCLGPLSLLDRRAKTYRQMPGAEGSRPR